MYEIKFRKIERKAEKATKHFKNCMNKKLVVRNIYLIYRDRFI